MNDFQSRGAAEARAMHLLSEAAGMSVHEIESAGFSTPTARRMCKLSTIYFGPTRFRKQQRQAREEAIRAGHTLDTLQLIESNVAKLADEAYAWKLRRDLCRLAANYRKLRTAARERVEHYNGPREEQPARPRASMSNPPGSLERTIHWTGAESKIAAVWDQVRDHATKNNINESDALFELFSNRGISQAEYTPAVIVSIGDLEAIYGGAGDDVILSATNGARMTGAEFLQQKLTDHGLAMLVSRVHGAVDLYTTQRLASSKQRKMCSLESPTCGVPDCGQGADRCQVNHNVAWSHGGPTNLSNLSMSCPFHNGRLDDDRRQPRNGHLVKHGGLTYHVGPFNGGYTLNDHPTARGGAMRVT
ncbi:HNH endonuclease signature motif containing protein [Corynebacterium breve]|uniref:HNH endonuclease signature motif containing protein n=1 Tax=Corynebacterium breve TaxID=3049799 RepID=A0ABY8VF52_9CORY|nr:HNH endonuclease signature motif containing protein [Corynebacterium breve]WIM68276.1 HNH endonuclease signature motif containing protein [Corynebacterium breve]